ncbi:MAG: hypothetical protein WC992_07110 [Acholeplasmataceae bacterium]|jgi:hypothetical protein|nr:hypothetical protein [Acholeplasmataceae bacterium]
MLVVKNRKQLLLTIIYLLMAFMLLSLTTYAWFIITNVNHTHLVSQISEVEAEYEFYRFKDKTQSENEQPMLFEQMCESSDDDACYILIPNPSEMFTHETSISPGEHFSFAIRIISIGQLAYLNLDLGKIYSIGETEDARIQEAFYYHVQKVSYEFDQVEGPDIKDQSPMNHYSGYFDGDITTIYPLIRNVPLNPDESVLYNVIIYFDFYYDPTLTFYDSYGVSYPNYNHLWSQQLAIEDIYMQIRTSTGE